MLCISLYLFFFHFVFSCFALVSDWYTHFSIIVFCCCFFFVTFLFLWIQIKNCCVADITKVRSYFNRLRNRHGNTSDGPFYICINDKNVSQRDKVWKSEQKREETTTKMEFLDVVGLSFYRCVHCSVCVRAFLLFCFGRWKYPKITKNKKKQKNNTKR